MAKSAGHPFGKHHAAAGKAFDAGDHSKAMHHIGHMMLAVRGAAKAALNQPGSAEATEPAAADQGIGDMDGDENASGIATPAPTPARQNFFGQFGPKATPKAKPHAAPKASPLTATNHAPRGGFNRARFSKKA